MNKVIQMNSSKITKTNQKNESVEREEKQNPIDKSFIMEKAVGFLIINGDVNVSKDFISLLEEELKNKQSYAEFVFTVGIKKDINSQLASQIIQKKYKCEEVLNMNWEYLIGFSGRFVINKREIPKSIIEFQNFCQENSIEPVQFVIII